MSSTTPLCRFRVLYLGSEVPTRSKDGLQGIQEPLELLYPEIGAPELAGVDAFLSVWSNGVLVEPAIASNHDSSSNNKRFYHIDSLHYCAAVRYSEYGGMDASSRDIGLFRFLPLDSAQARDSAAHHPPLFALIMRRASGIKLLECKVFVCKSDEAANELVRSCFRAYSDTAFAHVLEHAHPSQQVQHQQQSVAPIAVTNTGMPIVGHHGYAGSALMNPSSVGNRSLLISRMSNNSSSVEHLNSGLHSDGGNSRYEQSNSDKKQKKKKRSPFWPFAKPAGERRRSRSLNPPRPTSPSAARPPHQQHVQPILVTPSEYGSVVYYLPTEQPKVQSGTALVRMQSAGSQAAMPNLRNPQQPLHFLYAAASPQQSQPQWTQAAPVYIGGDSGGYIPTTASFVSNDYGAYYEKPPSMPSTTPYYALQQPWTTGFANYDDLTYYDPYNHVAMPHAVGSENGYLSSTNIKQPSQSSVNLRKAKSMAVRQETTSSSAETRNSRRHITSPHQQRQQRHRVRSGDISSSSTRTNEFDKYNAAAAAKPPIKLKNSLLIHHQHPDSNLPASSSSKTTSVSSSTTSSLSRAAPSLSYTRNQHRTKPPPVSKYLLSGDRSHAHTKSMVIPEDRLYEEEQEEDDAESAPEYSRAVVVQEESKVQRRYAANHNANNNDQSSTSSAFSSASGQHDHNNATSSFDDRQITPPPLPPPSPTSPSLLLPNDQRTTANSVISDAKYVKFDDGDYKSSGRHNTEHEIALLVDELRIDNSPNKLSSNRDHSHWQQVTTKTKVHNVKQSNKVTGSVSVSPVDSGQHEPATLAGVDHDLEHEQQHSNLNRWQSQKAHNKFNELQKTSPASHSNGDRPYIPEVDYDV